MPSLSLGRPLLQSPRAGTSAPAEMTPPLTPASARASTDGKVKSRTSSLSKSHQVGAPLPENIIPPLRELHAESPSRRLPSTPSMIPSQSDSSSTGEVAFSSDLPLLKVPGLYELRTDSFGGSTEYGRGAWSVVAQADYREPTSTGALTPWSSLPSPPLSPVVSCETSDSRIVAVKAPLPNSLEKPRPVLEKEARILSYLNRLKGQKASLVRDYVVPFLGFEPTTGSLVYEALPLTLAAFSQQKARASRDGFSTRSMQEPVVGPQQWQHFAIRLVTGLAFLHDQKVVHGDVKPMNILLRMSPNSKADPFGGAASLFDPVYCDFTSSRVEQGIEPEEVNAVSTEYTAPELLEAFYHRRSQRAVTTFASDVFALGATLLVPAIGQDLYADIKISIQRLTMARLGQPLDAARGGDEASRIMKGRLVDRAVAGALKKNAEQRWTASTWREVLLAEKEGWENGKGPA